MDSWIRARFIASDGDARPVTWPPPGPFWLTGYDFDDQAVVVAYVRDETQVREFWPDAENIEADKASLTFSARFPRPEWWTESPDA